MRDRLNNSHLEQVEKIRWILSEPPNGHDKVHLKRILEHGQPDHVHFGASVALTHGT